MTEENLKKADLAKRIGTDAALTTLGGGLAKGAVKATKAIPAKHLRKTMK